MNLVLRFQIAANYSEFLQNLSSVKEILLDASKKVLEITVQNIKYKFMFHYRSSG